jgi:hypothetical protein
VCEEEIDCPVSNSVSLLSLGVSWLLAPYFTSEIAGEEHWRVFRSGICTAARGANDVAQQPGSEWPEHRDAGHLLRSPAKVDFLRLLPRDYLIFTVLLQLSPHWAGKKK